MNSNDFSLTTNSNGLAVLDLAQVCEGYFVDDYRKIINVNAYSFDGNTFTFNIYLPYDNLKCFVNGPANTTHTGIRVRVSYYQ